MTFWLATKHLTNFQILLVNFQLRGSLPVTFDQILLTGQPLVNFRSFTINFLSLTVNFPSLLAISITFNHQVFWTPKRDVDRFEAFIGLYFHTENRMKSMSQFLAKMEKFSFGTFWDRLDRKTGKPDFSQKNDLGQF